jgi:hypothetical protein
MEFLSNIVVIFPVRVYLFYHSVNLSIVKSNKKLIASITIEKITDKTISPVP